MSSKHTKMRDSKVSEAPIPKRPQDDRGMLSDFWFPNSNERLIKRLAKTRTDRTALLMLAAIVSCNQRLLEILSTTPEPDPEEQTLQSAVRENFSRLASAFSAYLEQQESRSGSPKDSDDWRELRETLHDFFGQSQRLTDDDHFWDTGSAFSLERIAGDLTTTRGSMVIKGGIVHRKGAPPARRCPLCGGELKRANMTMRFNFAPPESAEQAVPGYLCECGETWPDPRSVRNAHRAAFKS